MWHAIFTIYIICNIYNIIYTLISVPKCMSYHEAIGRLVILCWSHLFGIWALCVMSHESRIVLFMVVIYLSSRFFNPLLFSRLWLDIVSLILLILLQQVLTISIKLLYVITHVSQNFSVCEVRRQYQKAYIRHHTFCVLICLKIFLI